MAHKHRTKRRPRKKNEGLILVKLTDLEDWMKDKKQKIGMQADLDRWQDCRIRMQTVFKSWTQ